MSSSLIRKTTAFAAGSLLAAIVVLTTGCDSVDSERIPAYKVQIALNSPGLWDTYGVGGYGVHREFILATRTPSNFPFTETTFTGYGGVLLIMGMDPFGQGDVIPLAYDLACPVECKPDIRVAVDDSSLEAVCPVCRSHYDVTMSGGAPVSGPAATGDVKYGLQRYRAYPSNGGYVIGR